jgi:hypothetical protein
MGRSKSPRHIQANASSISHARAWSDFIAPPPHRDNKYPSVFDLVRDNPQFIELMARFQTRNMDAYHYISEQVAAEQ